MFKNIVHNVAIGLICVGMNTSFAQPVGETGHQVVVESQILAINDTVKQWLDEHIRPIRGKESKALALHEYLFTASGREIEYAMENTKTAQETFDSGYGNCVSLANIYVASARYLGLKAKFQKVRVPRDWERADEFFILPDHMNVGVSLNGGTKATVELMSTNVSTRIKDKPISDKQAFAEYYSNVGVEHLAEKSYGLGVAYLEQAVKTDAKSSVAWSNLGVAYKLNGQLDLAEAAYLKALKYDKHNLPTLKNLYVLYFQQGDQEKVDKLSSVALRYSKKNPYFLAKTGDILFRNGDYIGAEKFYNKAIRKKDSEASFYSGLAKAQFKLGKQEAALKSQTKAIEYAEDAEFKQRYKAKYKYLLGSL